MSNTFIQIHTLTGYPGVLLNRDDTGSAKRLPFGGSSRIRISSQSLKRHWRMAVDDWAIANIGVPLSKRSREIVEVLVRPALAGVASDETINSVVKSLNVWLYGKNGADKDKRQALLLGAPEIKFITELALEACKAAEGKEKVGEAAAEFLKASKASLSHIAAEAGKIGAGLEAALFGRMVTSDTASNIDAPIHVAHAFTVHREEAESDYFTAVDDLDTVGSAGMFTTELTSGLFYGYVVIDTAALVSNVGGDVDVARKVVEHLIHLIATVSPGAKKGSTAPYSYADFMLVEVGKRQPRTLANAFRDAVPLREGDVLDRATSAISNHLGTIDAAYGQHEARSLLSLTDVSVPGVVTKVNLDQLALLAADAVRV